mmetsp:Transcript_26454/g.39136  ORF Transcript_26454/g.39136 Transcript_26454/m.39136 type:complete len:239 (-) Transcript_26454:46-762(-)
MGKKSGGRVRVKQMGPKGGMPNIGNPMEELAIPPDQMIQLPPPVDKNMSQIWPLGETFTMNYDRFPVIYPNYLDSSKTVKQGRRISVVEAVEKPTVMDIGAALQSLGMRHVVQPYKGYSRDADSQWENLGRVLIDLPRGNNDGVAEIGADGAFDISGGHGEEKDSTVQNKKQLLRLIAARIPHLISRKERIAREKAQQEAEEKQAKEEAAAAHKAASQKVSTKTSSSNRKKKGKKKGK